MPLELLARAIIAIVYRTIDCLPQLLGRSDQLLQLLRNGCEVRFFKPAASFILPHFAHFPPTFLQIRKRFRQPAETRVQIANPHVAPRSRETSLVGFVGVGPAVST